MALDTYLTPAEVAAQIGHISESTVTRARRRGELAGTRIGRQYRFRIADVETWLESRRTPVTATTFRARPTRLVGTGKRS
jgi:excisionase family DNA binding protein